MAISLLGAAPGDAVSTELRGCLGGEFPTALTAGR